MNSNSIFFFDCKSKDRFDSYHKGCQCYICKCYVIPQINVLSKKLARRRRNGHRTRRDWISVRDKFWLRWDNFFKQSLKSRKIEMMSWNRGTWWNYDHFYVKNMVILFLICWYKDPVLSQVPKDVIKIIVKLIRPSFLQIHYSKFSEKSFEVQRYIFDL